MNNNKLVFINDAKASCKPGSNNPPEEILGTFNFKDNDDNDITSLHFTFWRNIHSSCDLTTKQGIVDPNPDRYSDYIITDNDLVQDSPSILITINQGSIKIFKNNILVHTLTKNPNVANDFDIGSIQGVDRKDIIQHLPYFGDVSSRGSEVNNVNKIIIQKDPGSTEDPSFTISAKLNWDLNINIDRDIYGQVSCYPVKNEQLFDKSSWSSTVPEPYLTALNNAADRWSQFIKFDSDIYTQIQDDNPGWNGIQLQAFNAVQNVDFIAACVPTQDINLQGIKHNTIKFTLDVNTDQENRDDWAKIMTHELGHALGVGVFWSEEISGVNFIIPANTNPEPITCLNGLVYTNTKEAYNAITQQTVEYIPLYVESEVATHWRGDSWSISIDNVSIDLPSINKEIMTKEFLSNDAIISKLTIKLLVDFGYQETNPGANEGNPVI